MIEERLSLNAQVKVQSEPKRFSAFLSWEEPKKVISRKGLQLTVRLQPPHWAFSVHQSFLS